MQQKKLPQISTLRNRGTWPGKSVLSMFIKALSCYINVVCKSSRPEMFCEKGVLINFPKLTGKHLRLRPATLLKERLWHKCFPVTFAKFLRIPNLTEHPQWLLLGLQNNFRGIYI